MYILTPYTHLPPHIATPQPLARRPVCRVSGSLMCSTARHHIYILTPYTHLPLHKATPQPLARRPVRRVSESCVFYCTASYEYSHTLHPPIHPAIMQLLARRPMRRVSESLICSPTCHRVYILTPYTHLFPQKAYLQTLACRPPCPLKPILTTPRQPLQVCVGCKKVLCVLLHCAVCTFSQPTCPFPLLRLPLTLTSQDCNSSLQTHCTTMQRTAPQCNALHHNATHYTTHCHTLQHTATHCNTLQHTATHYNTPSEPRP